MEIKEIKDKTIWESFFKSSDLEDKTFLQSFAWGEFQEKMGNKIWRLGIFNDSGNLILAVLVSKISAKRGKFLQLQHLVSNNINREILKELLCKLKSIGKEEGAAFIRIAPLLKDTKENNQLFQNLGFRVAPMHANAYEATWRLRLDLPEDDIFKNMRKTTRYLIRQAQSNQDVSIVRSESILDIHKYQKLNIAVAKRQGFTPFSGKYIKNEFEVFSKEQNVLWFFGKYKENLACAALIIFWAGRAFYHQAASDGEYKKLSIPYLLQWEAILEAKKRGCDFYDFWGFTDPLKHPKHPWAGPTLFKMGFGGESREYIKTHDYPLSFIYYFTFLFEKLRSLKRGF